MRMIWATRGQNWGFRFLCNGGFPDPLPEYEKAFEGHVSEPQLWIPGVNFLTLRFPDPLGRKDLAGRTISHDFVIYSPPAEFPASYEGAKQRIWAEAAQDYADVWDGAI